MERSKILNIAAILLLIIVVGFFAYNFGASSTDTPPEEINFNEEGNLIKNNPGFKPGVWFLVYEKAGSPALSVELLFEKIEEPNLTVGQRVYVEGILNGSVVSVTKLESIDTEDTEMTIKLYYYNPDLDQGPGGAQCSRNGLVAVERIIPKTVTPLSESIKLLLRGEITQAEKAEGITTEFPLPGLALTSASITDGVATLNFSDPQNKTGGGSCRVSVLWAQIEATAKQFPTVTSVRFMPEELFQP